ncbi:hypothetical protein [Variovorax saccharolyticus]|uniref:hypothetical protein n=1 Tax=Variovorax saccharolyticus TaxID=3053516 RepID=UPI0025776A68|nr:hypothetical protein [Variovorax sp. J22R187]MDM0016891.1 hypothetical protein [Variovorax sp. J22R187]
MPQVKVTVINLSGQPQLVHVFDTLNGGTRPVEGNPFELSNGQRSAAFDVNADARGRGILAFRSRSGIVRTGIEVTDGSAVEIR